MLNKNSPKKNSEKEAFIKKFYDITGDNISYMELAEIRGNGNTFKFLDLPMRKNEYSVWGILIAGEKSNYFFKAAREATYMGISLGNKPEYQEEDKLVNLGNLNNLEFSLLEKKPFDFLMPERKRTLDATFIDDSGTKHLISFIFAINASTVFENLHK